MDAHTLNSLLEREAEAAERLHGVLEREYAALKRRDGKSLDAVVKEKQASIEALQALGTERTRLLEAATGKADKESFEALLAELDAGSGQLAQAWDRVRSHLDACQHQNQLNGRLIEPSRRQAQEALAILIGQERNTSQTYDQKGHTKGSLFSGGRSIKA